MASAQTKIYLTASGNTISATLTDNEATSALVDMLANGPISIEMNEYGGFEKVGSLPQPLPTSDSRITTQPGDIMLYQGQQIVIFYGSNTWSYTRLGKIDGSTVSNLREFLGNGNVTIELSLEHTTAISDIPADKNTEQTVYNMQGNRISHRPLAPGIYIIDGKKTRIGK